MQTHNDALFLSILSKDCQKVINHLIFLFSMRKIFIYYSIFTNETLQMPL
ncbi:hypothetical protein B4129_1517 [Bacillus safensis]|nr:hypothetical protein B4129_1517 [Bacillus safensis]